MTKRRAALLTVVLVLVALLAWFASDGGVEATSPVPASPAEREAPARGFIAAAPSPRADVDELAQRPGRGGLPGGAALDAGATGVDANEAAEALRTFTDGAIRAKLERNGKRAAEELDRFCELNAKLQKQPLFPDAPGKRDAAVFMASRVDWEGSPARYGSLHVSEAVKAHAGVDWLFTVTDTDLAGLDFSWMKQLLAYDVWTFAGDGAADDLSLSAIASNIPNFLTMQTQVKLRFARAYRDGDWNDAVVEVRHLARLIHTMSIAVGEAIAVALLRMEVRARDQATRLGVDVSSFPPPLDPSTLDAHRITGVKSGWFVAPGVPEAVRKRALECSAMKCTTVLEGLSLHSSLRPWAPPGSLESFLGDTRGLGCEPALLERLVKMPPAKLEDLQWLLSEEDEGPILPLPADAGR
ncbi:MAG: hypothetical protein Q8L48_21400 [Archangium sp.]|nr:hypothetical protein [Archangium sp.]